MKHMKFGWMLFACGLALAGCEEKEELVAVKPAEAVEAMEEFMVVNRLFQQVSSNTDESVLKAELQIAPTLMNTMPDAGPVITVQPMDNTWPKTITVDFGANGITGYDGVTRRGILVITSSARYSATNSTHTTTFNNFYHNNHKIEGTHVAKNLGLIDGVLTFNVKVQNGKVTAPTGEVVAYEQNSTRSWVAGTDSPLNIWDDEYELEGTQEGVSSKGVKYTMTVGEPLHVVVYPRAITSGTLEVKMEGLPTMLFNYEDNTITIGGQTYPLGT